jgi:hypothetical protein
VVVFGCAALLLGCSRWLGGRTWAAAGNVTLGVLLLAVAIALWPAVLHLRTYERLPSNGIVAQVHCERTGPATYRLTLTRLPHGRMQVYAVSGDQWRLDARTLIWKERAARLGLPSRYRFERLSARRLRSGIARDAGNSSDTGATSSVALPEGYALAGAEEVGDDVWSQARTGGRWSEAVEPGRAYGPWRPLVDGARYDVWMSPVPGTLGARMDARPVNAAGTQAMRYTAPHNDKVRATQG